MKYILWYLVAGFLISVVYVIWDKVKNERWQTEYIEFLIIFFWPIMGIVAFLYKLDYWFDIVTDDLSRYIKSFLKRDE